MLIRITLSLAAVLAVAGCNRPPAAPSPEKPPEPQASALRDAMQKPLDKANAARAALEKAPDTSAVDEAESGR